MEYVVKDNDTLNSIADKYNISLNELKNYNNLYDVTERKKLIYAKLI